VSDIDDAPRRSARQLWVLTVLALVAVAVASIDAATPAGGIVEERLFPRFDAQDVVAIRWGQGEGALVVERGTQGLVITRPHAGPVRPAAIDAFFGAVAMLRPMRAVGVDEAISLRSVEIDLGTRRLHFAVATGERVGWIEYAGTHYAIPLYLARELDLHADEIRATRPFAALGTAEASSVVVGGEGESTIVEGPPWQILYREPKGRLFADPDVVDEVLRLLRGISYRRFVAAADPDAPASSYVKARVGVDWVAMEVIGRCDDGDYLVTSMLGAGCVGADAIDPILHWGRDGKRLLDRHLVVPGRHGEVATVRIARGGQELELRGGDGWRAGGQELEALQVLAWLRRFDDLVVGDPIPVPEIALEPRAAVDLELTDGSTLALRFMDVDGSPWVRRGDEPALWPVSKELDAVVRPDVSIFAGLELIDHSSMELTRAVARKSGAVVQDVVRGTLLSDWSTPVPGRRVDAAAVTALAHAVGYLHAESHLGPGELGDVATEIELHFEDALAAVRQVVQLHVARGDAGCVATIGDSRERFALAASDCDALLGAWTRPR